jgi:hypothetical protein
MHLVSLFELQKVYCREIKLILSLIVKKCVIFSYGQGGGVGVHFGSVLDLK